MKFFLGQMCELIGFKRGVMGAFARGAVKPFKDSFGYHGLIANRAEYKPKKNIENRVGYLV